MSKIDQMKRKPFDEIMTPENAVIPLLEYIHPWEEKPVVWEPTAPPIKSGWITQVLLEAGYDVWGTHIDEGMDFLTCTPDFEFDMIITNPPYSIKDQFIARCFEWGKPFALLLPMDALGAKGRGKMFYHEQPSVLVFPDRLDFTGSGKPWFYNFWLLHNMKPGYGAIEWLEPK